jgi:pimeloyl-ACP methyl ester carboxylesterase
MRRARRLDDRYTVVSYDQRGHSRSKLDGVEEVSVRAEVPR